MTSPIAGRPGHEPSATGTDTLSPARVNSSGNPFAPERLESLEFHFPQGVTWETLLERLKTNQYCAAIVGRHGSGKTLLLHQMMPRLQELGFEPHLFRIAPESSLREKERLTTAFRDVTAPGFILLDGAEQLSTRQWLPVRSAASRAAGFLVTVHRVSRLPALIECESSPKLLDKLVHELSGAWLPGDEAETLFSRHNGNIRAALEELHRRWDGK